MTADLDILISVEEMSTPQSGLVMLDPIYEYLRKAGYAEFKHEGVVIEDWPVQFLPVASALDAEGLARAVEVEISDGPDRPPLRIPVLRAEHLVAKALTVGRVKDHARIVDFIDQGGVNFEALADVLDRYDLREAWAGFCRKAGLNDPSVVELKS